MSKKKKTSYRKRKASGNIHSNKQIRRHGIIYSIKKHKKPLIISVFVIFAGLLLIVINVTAKQHIRSLTEKNVTSAYDENAGYTIVTFGEYPQSQITDAELIKKLSATDLKWKYYNDFSGDDYYGTAKKTDCSKYADTEYDGKKYRAVYFGQYRPACTTDTSSAENSYQQKNGYECDKIYWFIYEPIEWLILSSDNTLITKKILDAMPFNNEFYWRDCNFNGVVEWENEFSSNKYLGIDTNKFRTSSVRDWLKNDFLQTAFTQEQTRLLRYKINNNGDISNAHKIKIFNNTVDRIFLASFSQTSYIPDITAQGTDYARCRGLWTNECDEYYGCSWYWLRNIGDFSGDVVSVSSSGTQKNEDQLYYWSYRVGGIRCCISIDLSCVTE